MGAFIVLAVIALGLAYIHDRREQNRRERLSA